jgi:hypothetical protein
MLRPHAADPIAETRDNISFEMVARQRWFDTQRIDVAVIACRLPVRLLRLQLKLSRRLAEIARTCSATIWRRQQRAARNYHDVEILATRSRSTRRELS